MVLCLIYSSITNTTIYIEEGTYPYFTLFHLLLLFLLLLLSNIYQLKLLNKYPPYFNTPSGWVIYAQAWCEHNTINSNKIKGKIHQSIAESKSETETCYRCTMCTFKTTTKIATNSTAHRYSLRSIPNFITSFSNGTHNSYNQIQVETWKKGLINP